MSYLRRLTPQLHITNLIELIEGEVLNISEEVVAFNVFYEVNDYLLDAEPVDMMYELN